MADMWRSRSPPLPLDFDAIRNGTFVLREQPPAQTSAVPNGPSKDMANGTATNGASGSKSVEKLLNGVNGPVQTAAGLKDQRSLTLGDNLALFVSRYAHSSRYNNFRLMSWCEVPTSWLLVFGLVRILFRSIRTMTILWILSPRRPI
jgi:hypothetical protein